VALSRKELASGGAAGAAGVRGQWPVSAHGGRRRALRGREAGWRAWECVIPRSESRASG